MPGFRPLTYSKNSSIGVHCPESAGSMTSASAVVICIEGEFYHVLSLRVGRTNLPQAMRLRA